MLKFALSKSNNMANWSTEMQIRSVSGTVLQSLPAKSSLRHFTCRMPIL
ncbi:hypothetical protein Nmel_014037 [Mimus melanotis]